MGVTIRQKPKNSGIWYVFINHQGKRHSIKEEFEAGDLESIFKRCTSIKAVIPVTFVL